MNADDLKEDGKDQALSDFSAAPAGTVGQIYHIGPDSFSIQWLIPDRFKHKAGKVLSLGLSLDSYLRWLVLRDGQRKESKS